MAPGPMTLGDMQRRDEDPDERDNEYYAGGAQSGMAVQDPITRHSWRAWCSMAHSSGRGCSSTSSMVFFCDAAKERARAQDRHLPRFPVPFLFLRSRHPMQSLAAFTV